MEESKKKMGFIRMEQYIHEEWVLLHHIRLAEPATDDELKEAMSKLTDAMIANDRVTFYDESDAIVTRMDFGPIRLEFEEDSDANN
jgi:hypothetical protein